MDNEIHVHLACNQGGYFSGSAGAFEFQTEDTEARLLGDPPVAVLFATGALVVAGVRYPIGSRERHVGNWEWDAVTMSLDDARRLVSQLLTAGFWAEEWSLDGPFTDLIEEAD